MLTSQISWSRFLTALVVLVAAAGVFIFSGTENAPADRSSSNINNSYFTLRVEPQQAPPGKLLQVHVLNGSGEILTYDLGHFIERLGPNGWVDAMDDFYGHHPGEWGALAAREYAQPGESVPAEFIDIPDTVEPGLYRVVKIADIDFEYLDVGLHELETRPVIRILGEFAVTEPS